MTVKTAHPKYRAEYEIMYNTRRSGWLHVIRKRVGGVLMDMYAAITDDHGNLVRIDAKTTPPLVLRPGDGS